MANLGFRIQAIEPSTIMHGQAPHCSAVHWHYGTAEHIPPPDNSVAGVFCILASHHFTSHKNGAIEWAIKPFDSGVKHIQRLNQMTIKNI
jgi:hypothetical protein